MSLHTEVFAIVQVLCSILVPINTQSLIGVSTILHFFVGTTVQEETGQRSVTFLLYRWRMRGAMRDIRIVNLKLYTTEIGIVQNVQVHYECYSLGLSISLLQ